MFETKFYGLKFLFQPNLMECNINWIYCIRAEENSGPANQNILSRNHSLLFRSLNTAKSLPLYLCFYLLIRFMLVLSLSLSHFLFFISWMILVKSTLVSKKLLGLFCYPKVFETFSDRNKNLIGGLLPKHKKVL